MRTVVQSSIIRVLMMCLLFSGGTSAQTSTKSRPTTPKAPTTPAKCHSLLTGLQGKGEGYFNQKNDEELADLQSLLDDCVRNAYQQLPRLDLAVAGVAAAMVAREVQSRSDQGAYQSLLEEYRELQKQNANKASGLPRLTLTISPLPNGKTWNLNIGGKQVKCSTSGTMQMTCVSPTVGAGEGFETYLVAMIATPDLGWQTTHPHSFLIGCSGPSPNCTPLVPGEYSAELAGTDGVSIAGLVDEDKPTSAPRHGIYTIYSRGELP